MQVELTGDSLSPNGMKALTLLYKARNLARFGVELMDYDGEPFSWEEIEARIKRHLSEFSEIIGENPEAIRAITLFFVGVLEFVEEILLGNTTLAAQNVLGEDVGLFVSREQRERALLGMSLLLSNKDEMDDFTERLKTTLSQLQRN